MEKSKNWHLISYCLFYTDATRHILTFWHLSGVGKTPFVLVDSVLCLNPPSLPNPETHHLIDWGDWADYENRDTICWWHPTKSEPLGNLFDPIDHYPVVPPMCYFERLKFYEYLKTHWGYNLES